MSREDEVFRAVWEDGMPASERLIYEAVPPEQRPLVVERLDAAFRATNGEPWKPLADKLGLKRSAFYDLRNGWKERKLSGVIPYDSRGARALATKKNDPVRSSAKELLRRKKRGTRNVDIAKLLLDKHGDLDADVSYNMRLAALQRMERLVQEERRELARDPRYLAKAYGQRVIIDLTAVSIVLEAPQPSLAVVAVVLEEASGLIMGSALSTLDEAANAQIAAVESALGFLTQRQADIDTKGTKSDLVLIRAPGSDLASGDEALLAEFVRGLSVAAGTYAFGQNLVQTIGPRVGRTVINPRSTLAIDVTKHLETRIAEVMTLEMAQARWGREVFRHNEPILQGLREHGLVDGAGERHGLMAQALRGSLIYLGGVLSGA